jgi:hypothetical protein
VTLAESASLIPAFVIDGLDVYYFSMPTITPNTTEIYRVPKTGGAVSLVATVPGDVASVAITGVYLYMAGFAGVFRIHKQHGSVQLLADGDGFPSEVEVAGNRVYFSRLFADTIESVPVDGGAIDVLASGLNAPNDLAIRDGYVYFTELDSGGVKRVPQAGGPVESLSNVPDSRGIAVDDVSIYWTVYCGPSCGETRTMPKDGGISSILSPSQDMPHALAIDATRVFWVTAPVQGTSSAGVYAVSKSGGSTTTLASGYSVCSDIAVDDACVYFADAVFDGGNTWQRVLRVAKPP